MRRNLLVKVEGAPLGRKTSLCQGAKDPSTVFKNVKEGAVSGAKEKRARDKGLFRRQSGRGKLWGDSE